MARKFTANFNEFAQWYIGKQCTEQQIVEYFEEALWENVQQYIGREVQIVEQESPNGYYDYEIEGKLLIEAVEQFA